MLARHRIRGCLFAARAKQNSRPPFAAASSSTVLSATLPSRRQSYTEIQQQQIYCFHIRLFSTSNSPTASTSSPILLNPDFALKQEWAERLKHLGKEKLGYDAYEWITLIQKKFTGGGKASAVDLDIACALAQRVDQIRDLLDLCYRFRHTDNAGDLFPSTEYAFLRLLLDYDDMGVFWKLLNDPINYGLFPDEHICSMYLNYFLTAGRLSEAARLAVYVMQQELFDFPLLNHLATRALLQFVEEPTADGPTSPLSEFGELEFPRQAQTLEEELSFNEENVRIFRFPWLKVPHSDGHFDLNRTDQMVGKSLEWLSRHLKLADDATNKSKCETLSTGIRCLGLVLQQKFVEAKEELGKPQLKELLDNPELKSILISALQLARPFLLDNAEEKKDGAEQKEVEEDSAEKRQQLLALVDQICGMTTAKDSAPKRAKLWPSLQQAFQPIQSIEERKVMDHQRQAFRQWEHKRFEFIESQTRRLELNLRLEEIGRRRKELAEQKDLLLFFDNRHIWEDKALQRHELEFHLGMLKKKGELTEDEYAKGLFQMGQLLKEGKTAAQALEQIQPGLGADIRVAKAKTTRK